MNVTRILLTVGLVAAGLAPGVARAEPGARVIVSTTLNDTLQFFDAGSLAPTQPPVPSRGGGPVRMWVEGDHLFVANHGAPLGSVGVFDLSDALPVVTELPLSPFPTGGMGSVGITASQTSDGLVVWATNTTFALGGCSMPKGTLTAFDGSMLSDAGVLRNLGSAELTGSIPYGVAARGDVAVASLNCGSAVDYVTLGPVDDCPVGACVEERAPRRTASNGVGAGPDAVLYDEERELVYTTNITGDSVTVLDATFPNAITTVPLPGTGPIDATLATSAGGRDWLLSSNGEDDTMSVIDRDLIVACIVDGVSRCDAEIARIPTGVPGGAPEGVAFDAATNRAFVVNKGILEPSLSVITIDESGDELTWSYEEPIALNVVDPTVPPPAFIAFDVVVQPR